MTTSSHAEHDRSPSQSSGFMRLPAELRLSIYKLLLTDHEDKTIQIRTLDAKGYSQVARDLHRSRYRILSGRLRSCSTETTYAMINRPADGLHTGILRVNRQVHAEAAHLLYAGHIFDFDQDVEAAVPFFSDLTPLARAYVAHISITQRALPYRKSFDKYEWASVCEYIALNLQLKRLGLGVVGGEPEQAYEMNVFQKADYALLLASQEAMEWVQQLLTIKGLEDVMVKTHWDVSPPPVSSAIAFYLNFSRSIEFGFSEYLRECLLVKVA